MGQDKEEQEYKGSRAAMLDLIGNENFKNQLIEIINQDNVQFSDKELFIPKSKEDVKEAELKDFLKDTEWTYLGDGIKKWWLEIFIPNVRTPNWDFISTCTINGQKGLLLVEAKAHSSEVNPKDKCTSENEANINKIENAINEAKDEINKVLSNSSISISKDSCYQLSNRIAHAWWLANQGIPVVLLYLGFLNRSEMTGNGTIFMEDSDWQTCFKDYAANVGVDNLIDKEINTGKSQFKLICRSY
ncbi:MAG: hypothetical protein GW761_12455 [Leptospira sp.]|nr:hypothetical protein [Leptospira sp.]